MTNRIIAANFVKYLEYLQHFVVLKCKFGSRAQMTGRAADQVVEAMTRRIRDGVLCDGDPLPAERDMMAEFGISRTVAREAVSTLSSHGLIEAKPRHRPIVRKPGVDAALDAASAIIGTLLSQPSGVRNLFDTRIIMEVALVRGAATDATKTDIRALKDALHANGAAIHDTEKFFETDIRFHSVFYSVSGNPVLPAIHHAYVTWLAPHWNKMPGRDIQNELNFQSHTAILDAVLMRDPDAAEAAMRKHMDDAWQQVRQTFGDP